jgi:hypothetical protein
MYRLFLVGLLLFAIPAVVVAQEDKDKAKDAATDKANKEGDKAKAGSGSSDVSQVTVHRNLFERVVDAGPSIASLLSLILLCLIALLLMGLRSDIAKLMDKGGPS